MKKLKHSVYGWLYLLLVLTIPLSTTAASEQSIFPSDTDLADACFNPLKLEHTRLKDHTLFFYDDFYYIASIHLPRDEGQFKDRHFVYARTRDFCTWEDLGIILEPGPEGAPDEGGIWAPYVIREGDTFFMFYTGFNRNVAQSIMLATSTNPADPESWARRGLVFQPHHEDVVYDGSEPWSDGRDPMVLRYNDRYFLYYTGRDQHGGIVGVAIADDLMGPWRDLGPVLRLPEPDGMPESPFVINHDGYFYIYYNATGSGQRWQWAPSPFGPWQSPVYEPFGWAHDFYFDGTRWLASYLNGYGEEIQVRPVRWQTHTNPATPMIHYRSYLPLLRNVE